MHHIIKLRLVIKRHTCDGKFGEQVIFTYLAPQLIIIVIPCPIEAGIVHICREVIIRLIIHKAIQ